MHFCHFVKDAIRLEREAITRTYLIINDERWEEGRVQIDGYFSIAIKVIYFHGIDLGILENAFGNGSQKNCPAFLIGQLARGVHSPKGSGAEYLKKALSYVASVKDIIGGDLCIWIVYQKDVLIMKHKASRF